jgi:hypothetical protein
MLPLVDLQSIKGYLLPIGNKNRRDLSLERTKNTEKIRGSFALSPLARFYR